jgi:integrase
MGRAMPTFLEHRKRNPWKGQVKRKGFKPEAAYFPTEDEAKEWEENRRGALRRKAQGMTVDIADLQKITIGQMIDRYLKEETASKACHVDEAYRIEIFRNWNKIQYRPLIAFTRSDAIEFRNYLEREYQWIGKTYTVRSGRLKGKVITPKRKPKSLKPGSVYRMIAIFRDMWNIAANDWKGYESLKELGNPWVGIRPSKTPKKRTRRLNDLPSRKKELERLLDATKRCSPINKIYVPLAINLAVQTGMRLQEIMTLYWTDIDTEEMTINIRKSKTDYKSDDDGRTIALPEWTYIYLTELIGFIHPIDGPMSTLKIKKINENVKLQFQKHERIFPMTSDAFEQAWKRVTKYAGIPSKEEDKANGIRESQQGLEFKDLRREAGSRFDEAELTKAEHDLMLGHDSQEIRDIYIAPYLKKIRQKLDAYWMQVLRQGAVSFSLNGAYTVTPYDQLPNEIIMPIYNLVDGALEKASPEELRRLDKWYAERRKKVEKKLRAIHKQQEEKKAAKERPQKEIDQVREDNVVVKLKRGGE